MRSVYFLFTFFFVADRLVWLVGRLFLMANETVLDGSKPRIIPTSARGLLVLALLYLFLTGVNLLGGGFKSLGSDLVDGLFQGISNPLAGLFVGFCWATVLVQSSSVSTAVDCGFGGFWCGQHE
jgi:Na+/phosphate symporter